MYPYVSDINVHASFFLNSLDMSIQHLGVFDTKFSKSIIDKVHGVDIFINKWETYIGMIK